MQDNCYMCDSVAATREHVPPKSFFPSGLRNGLITVPSCDAHNSDNSLDVEYVRNVLSTQHGTNNAAAAVFATTKRSLDRSPKLRARTFRDLKPVIVEGEETGAFPIDLPRHKRVMGAIAHALYFHDYGRKHRGDWQVFTPSFGYAGTVHDGQADPWANFRQLLDSGHYTPKPVPHPEVFQYEVLEMEDGQMMFRLLFYGRVVVNAWTHFQTFVHRAGG
jgi:hypothetical protein